MYRLLVMLLLLTIAGCGPNLELAGTGSNQEKPATTIVLESDKGMVSSFMGIAKHLEDKGYSVDYRDQNSGEIDLEPEPFEFGEIILSLQVQGNQDTSSIRVSGELDAHSVARQDVVSDMISKRTVEIKRTPMGRSEMRAAWLKMKEDVIDYPHEEVRYVRD